MVRLSGRIRGQAGLALAGLLFAACSTDQIAGPQPSAAPILNETEVPLPKAVTLCKIGPAGTTATFDLTRSSAFGVLTTPVTLEATSLTNPDVSKCAEVWKSVNLTDPTVTVTITEREQAGVEVYRITSMSDYAGLQEIDFPSPPSFSVDVDFTHGAIVFFKNQEVEIPGGGQGCTPGYWKQTQHFDSWTLPFTPETLFSAVFTDAFPGLTLLDVLDLGGGGLNALGRHTVAALLNAANPSVSYDLNTSNVITSFNNAYASGSKKTIEGAKNVFEGFNEQGCSID